MDNYCGEAFRKIRKEKGLTQSQFSEMIEVSDSFVGQIERGVSLPSYKVLSTLISTYRLDANIFFSGGSAQKVINGAFYELAANLSPSEVDKIIDILLLAKSATQSNHETVVRPIDDDN